MSLSDGPLCSLRGVEKSYSGVPALHPIDLDVHRAEVLALVGENGAGKSTLIKILSGVHAPDAGEITLAGARVDFADPRAAHAAGIATIHQELTYFDRLSVSENLLLGEPWPRRKWGAVDWEALHALALARLTRSGVAVEPRTAFGRLSAAEKQEVAIAREVARDARLLVLDEPTASLSGPDVDRLFDQLRRIRASGRSALYVSHRLEEVLAIADRIAVLRDGALVAVHVAREVDASTIVRAMVGRTLAEKTPRPRSEPGPPVLEVSGISRSGEFEDISFSLHRGEIVALAGLVGAGRSEIARALFGLVPLRAGALSLHGKAWSPKSAYDALARGVVLVPEERAGQALVLDHSLADNLSVGFSDLITRWGVAPPRRVAETVSRLVRDYRIVTADVTQPIATLSGGNQQKAVLARALEREPSVLILDEPTRGVDVGAKAEIHAMVRDLAARGVAVLVVSSDLPEVVALGDRVLVVREGRIVDELTGARRTPADALLAAIGAGDEDDER